MYRCRGKVYSRQREKQIVKISLQESACQFWARKEAVVVSEKWPKERGVTGEDWKMVKGIVKTLASSCT